MEDAATELAEYLRPTEFVDCDHADVVAYAESATADAVDPVERAIRLFYRVRDGIRYDPYTFTLQREQYRASNVVHRDKAFCVPKAILLVAACRASGIPARLGFADVRNHLQSEKLRKVLQTDLFAFHGYGEVHLDGRWVKATPAFNAELCEHFQVRPLEFDGRTDALFHEYSADGRRHMEYVRDRGTHADLPFEEMLRVFWETYGHLPRPILDDYDEAFHGRQQPAKRRES